MRNSGFQPTYEELKHSVCRFYAVPGICFQPTYEELKLEAPAWARRLAQVFSLPMRN